MSDADSSFDFLFGAAHSSLKTKGAASRSSSGKAEPDIWSVSRLVSTVHNVLAESFCAVWLRGEISNLSRPASGHLYFTLKDASAQIRVVMFKRYVTAENLAIKDGMEVVIHGEVGVYAGRGDLQFIADSMEPAGEGALKLAFEALKQRLHERGWFDEARKRPLPFLPKRVFLITSPTGAVVHDFLRTTFLRFPAAHVVLTPSRVQGEGAAVELRDAVRLADSVARPGDVIVLARGGGSLEDLWPFNDEGLAEAVLHASVPVVSAVGHEVDFTICDFVADRRAATPTAAAQLLFPLHLDLNQGLSALHNRLHTSVRRLIEMGKRRVETCSARLVHPRQRLNEGRMRLDHASSRLLEAVSQHLLKLSHELDRRQARLLACSPKIYVRDRRQRLESQQKHLLQVIKGVVAAKKQGFLECSGVLNALSPLAVLARGYSIVTRVKNAEIIRNALQVKQGEMLRIQPQKGVLLCRVAACMESNGLTHEGQGE
ncbi:MAG: exodeoxyribonuclease VII large subunit [Dissulfuribacterales bacterium]